MVHPFYCSLYLSTTLCIAQQNLSKSVNVVSDGVRVSSGHLCEAEAPTEAGAETSLTDPHCSSDFFGDNDSPKVVYSSHLSSCGAQKLWSAWSAYNF